MTARLDATARYAVHGHPGAWRYVGQATYLDDEGRTVEHDDVRMARVGQPDDEVWVSPGHVTRVEARKTTAA